MNLYKISQASYDYDTFDAAIVAAESEEAARLIKPTHNQDWPVWPVESPSDWCKTPQDVIVELIGKALDNTKSGVILSSFNAS